MKKIIYILSLSFGVTTTASLTNTVIACGIIQKIDINNILKYFDLEFDKQYYFYDPKLVNDRRSNVRHGIPIISKTEVIDYMNNKASIELIEKIDNIYIALYKMMKTYSDKWSLNLISEEITVNNKNKGLLKWIDIEDMKYGNKNSSLMYDMDRNEAYIDIVTKDIIGSKLKGKYRFILKEITNINDISERIDIEQKSIELYVGQTKGIKITNFNELIDKNIDLESNNSLVTFKQNKDIIEITAQKKAGESELSIYNHFNSEYDTFINIKVVYDTISINDVIKELKSLDGQFDFSRPISAIKNITILRLLDISTIVYTLKSGKEISIDDKQKLENVDSTFGIGVDFTNPTNMIVNLHTYDEKIFDVVTKDVFVKIERNNPKDDINEILAQNDLLFKHINSYNQLLNNKKEIDSNVIKKIRKNLSQRWNTLNGPEDTSEETIDEMYNASILNYESKIIKNNDNTYSLDFNFNLSKKPSSWLKQD